MTDKVNLLVRRRELDIVRDKVTEEAQIINPSVHFKPCQAPISIS